MKTRHLIISLAVTAATPFLSSCKLGHAYQKPVMSDMPAMLSISMPVDTLSLGDMDWHRVYPDTMLSALIERTLVGNRDLAIAASRVREYAASRRIATSKLLPEVSGNAYAQKEGLNYGGDKFSPDPEVGLKAQLTWEIDLWGNLRWGRDKAQAEYLATVEGERALRMSLVAAVAQSYFELVSLDNELTIVRQTLAARRENVRLARLRFEGGLTSESPYRQAQVEMERTAARIPVLEEQIDVRQNEIALLSGSFPTLIERASSIDAAALPATLPVGLSSEMLQRRPDIRQAEQQLIAANAAVGVAYTDRFPRLTLTAHGGLESDAFAGFLKSPMYYLGAGLLGPVFDGGRRQAQYRAKQEAYNQQLYSYQKSVLTAFTEARNAIISFNKANDIYASALQLEQSAKSAMTLVQKQYIAGSIAYIDVLDAQRSYFEAQIGLVDAVCHKQLALVTLYKALGGGWQN